MNVNVNADSVSIGRAPNLFFPGRSLTIRAGFFRGFLSYERNPMRTLFSSARP